MSRNKKFQINKFLEFFVIMLFLANTLLLAQEQKFGLKIQSNPTDLDYWWLEKNNFGIKYNDFHFQGKWKLKTSKTTYIVNIIGQDDEKKIYFNESFIKHNFSDKTFLRIGKYYKDFSKYINDELSSGHMLISHNAEPMPKIGLVTSQKIKKFDKLIFDFGIAHGIFKKDNYYTKAPLLHEKFFYMHIKKNDYQVSLGLVHEAIWAGGTPELGNQPSTFKDFLKIFISADGPLGEGEGHANALGSHIGIWDFSYEKNNNNRILKLYYQHYFEDTSSLRFRNEIDGLWGAELKNYLPNTTILVEYLDTTHAWLDPPYQRDYYYWNYQYKLGWSYNDYIIGNPFVHSFSLGKVIHLGASGEIFSSYYQIKASRKISTNDSIKYKISIGKTIKDKFDVNIFVVNNDQNNGIGFGFSTIF
mgnify:CR=1 FL=1